MSSTGAAGVELVLGLVRAAAGSRACGSCGRPLADAEAEAVDVGLELIVARLICPCGAVEAVEVRPAGEGGLVEIR